MINLIKRNIKNPKIKQFIKKCSNIYYNTFHASLFLINCKLKGICNTLTVNALIGGGRYKNCKLICNGKGNLLIIGKNCILKGVSFYFEGDNNSIIIGEGTQINASKKSRVCLNALEGKSIKIGAKCLLSNNIQFHTSDYHSIVKLHTVNRINLPDDIVIGDHCWIGLNSLILKGSTICDDIIVGAGSIVVGKHYTSNCIIAGNPARLVKENVSWDISKVTIRNKPTFI